MFELLDELLSEGKVVRLRIKGSSMLPFLRDGLDQVDLTTPGDAELIPGALVLFKYKDGFILHRIIRRKGNKLMIIGDNVYQSKEVVTTEQVTGIVRKIIYPGGRELSTNSLRWKILSACRFVIKPFYRLRQYLIKGGKKILSLLK